MPGPQFAADAAALAGSRDSSKRARKLTTNIIRNMSSERRGAYADSLALEHAATAFAEISRWPGYAVTPLYALSDVAATCGVAEILYKDESTRFGLGSFKALGGAYAVARTLQRQLSAFLGAPVSTAQLVDGAYREHTRKITVVCATDGNHGRSVAAGARLFGCKSVILVHSDVSEGRQRAIADQGASLVRIHGTYDDAVREALRMSRANGWRLIADTSSLDGTEACVDVMQGYTVMAAEILKQLHESGRAAPTHVFIQGGVGGLAASMYAYFCQSLETGAPIFTVVEPESADCLFQSARAGQPTAASGNLNTVMAGLACGRVSEAAWRILKHGAEFFMTIPDEAAIDAMRLLASRTDATRIISGESGVAGLAGLIAVAADPCARELIRLDIDSRVLLFGTEGATDPKIYEALTGYPAPAVHEALSGAAE